MKYRLTNKPIKSQYTKTLLTERGIDDISTFLNPSLSEVQKPDDLDNIGEGAALLIRIASQKNSILICADCDVDGYTSATIMYQYIQKTWPDITLSYFLHEGKQHGLEDMIEKIEGGEHYDLVIMPDASSNDFVYHERLKRIGIPVLVLDHHILETEVSDNAIIINNQSSQKYRNKELTGAGVAWQFCRYLDEVLEIDNALYFSDLAALGIVGDMGGLNEIENQAIIQYGLSRINNFFFQALINKQSYSMNEKVNPTTVAFYIVPLINAMIRVGSMAEKQRLFEAFLDGTRMVPSNKRGAKGAMELLAVESARECTNAKSRQDKKKEEIVNALEIRIHKLGLLDNKVLFIRLDEEVDDFPSVLNGLVAMQLSSRFQRPTIVARLNKEGYIRGSARGLNESELKSFKDFLNSSGLFEYTAGHDQAFGCSIKNCDLENFHKYANKALDDFDFSETSYDVNFTRHAADLDLTDLIFDIGAYEHIWGQKMPEPLLYIDDINLTSNDIQVCGARQDTVRFEKFGVTYIQFHAKQLIEDLQKYPEAKVNLIGRAAINEWMGNRKPQIIIKDYEVLDGVLSF